MKGNKIKRNCLFISFLFAILFSSAVSLSAQDAAISWTQKIDWEKNELTLTLETALDQSGPNRPAATIAAERKIDTALPRIFSEAFLTFQIDSTRVFKESIENGDFPVAELLNIAVTGKKSLPSYSHDLQRLSINYTYKLYDLLANYFVLHQQPLSVTRYIPWIPTREYTGIVIYAKGSLPVHGERFSSSLVPCLFPEIFDSQMNPLMLFTMGDPVYLKKWGSAAYTTSFDETPWAERIGNRPLHIIATGLYGKYPTDLKIPEESAAQIMANPQNRRLLAEGRVLIIFDADK